MVALGCNMLEIVWFTLTKREPCESAYEKRYSEKLNALDD